MDINDPNLEPDDEQDEQPLAKPGVIAPAETGTPKGKAELPETSAKDYGDNNERLPKHLQEKLKWLCDQLKAEDTRARRMEVKRIRQAREFWKGLQYQYYSELDGQWHMPFDLRSGQEDIAQGQQEPRYMFVTNYFQAFGLIITAVLSQDLPSVRLSPANSDEEEDRLAAEEGSSVMELIQRNNRAQNLLAKCGWLAYTDGKIGGYVRYVTDGQRFGYTDEPVLGERLVKAGFDTYNCMAADCGTEIPSDTFNGVCPTCGNDVGDDTFKPAPLVSVPEVQSIEKIANGQEVIDIVGGLELHTPLFADDQHQFPFLDWTYEAHVARLRAAYPHAADKIKRGSDTTSGEIYERQARLSLTVGGTQNPSNNDGGTNNLATYSRFWLRPWTFYLIEESDADRNAAAAKGVKTDRQRLLELFPMGAFVAFAGGEYCESRNESMDDGWRIMHSLPGDGQDRPALGTSFISPQERYNVMANLEMETAEHGIPTTFADPQVLDFDAYQRTTAEPGAIVPATMRAGVPMKDSFYETEPTQIAGSVREQMADISGELGQFLTGAFPALFGGDPGTDTVGGTVIQRDQALGRIGLVWRNMKFWWADLMLLGVECFKRNRTDDTLAQVTGDDGEVISKTIELAKLQGNLVAYPETDEQYPAVWSQQRQVYMTLLQSQDPMIQKILAHPDNLAFAKRLIGLTQLVIPDDEDRRKQHAEIREMLQGQPREVPALDPLHQQPVPGPDGQPQMTLKPSVDIDAETDNHAVEYATCERWLNSPRGQSVKKANYLAWLNVRAHALEHKAIAAQQAEQEAMAAAGQQPGAGGGPQKEKGAQPNAG